RFAHKVWLEDSRWVAFFQIPFASAGLDFAAYPQLFFNAFRFYRGERYGWHHTGFGGYLSLPMAKAVLLDFAQSGETTAEEPPEEKPLSAGGPGQRKRFSSYGNGLGMEYYPATSEIAAEVPPSRAQEMLRLTVNGKSTEVRRDANWPTRLVLKVAAEPGTPLEAKLAANGQIVLQKQFTAKAPAPWRHGVAKEYLDERVPYPWKTPSFDGNELVLKHGVLRFGDEMLPAQFRNCRGVEVLSGPVVLEAELEGEPLLQNKRAEWKATPTAVEMVSEAYPGVELKTRVEYDGFMTVRARLTGVGETVPDTLRLRIPLAAGLAKFVNRGHSQDLVQTGGHPFSSNARSDLWVGDRNGGIIFTYGHPLFFSAANGRQITLEGDELVLTFVDREGAIPPEDNVFEFHLQFTPFRDDAIPPLAGRIWHEGWSTYQSYPDLTKVPELKSRIQTAKNEGRDLYLYFGQVVAENAPEFAEYPADLFATPHRPWYKRAYDPGKGVPCSVVCFREETGELMLDRIDQLAETAGLRGVYLDGPTVAFYCHNFNHPCAEYLPAQWDGGWHEGCVAGQRSYIKRLRGIFDSRGVKNPIWHHTGGGLGLVHFSHCDFYYDGEQLNRYRRGYLLPPEVFSVIYSGYPFGFQGVFLPEFYANDPLTSRKALPWTAPHGVVCCVGCVDTIYYDYLDINRRHPDTRFYPYTGEQPHIRTLNDNTLCTSYYLAEDEAVLISGNIVYHGSQEIAVDLHNMFNTNDLQITCLNCGETPDFRDGVLRFTVP
ncbi:MAG: hypothetical protein J6Y80_03025, partial [Victivallales bacterium]|nr:hypothetical protein [Victivallales bacterium]